MQLKYSTWPKVCEYLKKSKGVIMPVGSIEQHGPSAPIGTDALCAEVISKEIGDRYGVMVGPCVQVGMSLHHMCFPGSMTHSPRNLQMVIEDYCVSLASHGFERFFLLNGHGGNIASIGAAIWNTYYDLRDSSLPHASKIRFDWASWWENTAVADLEKILFGDKNGGHATPAEISIAMCAVPEIDFSCKVLPPVGEPHDERNAGSNDFRAAWPDGRINSDPTLANKEAGRKLIDTAVEVLYAKYKALVEAK